MKSSWYLCTFFILCLSTPPYITHLCIDPLADLLEMKLLGLLGSFGGFRADGEDQPDASAGPARQHGGVPGGGKREAVVMFFFFRGEWQAGETAIISVKVHEMPIRVGGRDFVVMSHLR